MSTSNHQVAGVLIVAALLTLAGCSNDTQDQVQEQTPPTPAEEVRPPEAVTPPLDLSRDVLSEIEADIDTEIDDPDALLPDMFEQPVEEKKTTLSGKVLINEESTHHRELVDGVQIEVEIPTK